MQLRVLFFALESLLAPQFDPVFFNGQVFGAPLQAPPKIQPASPVAAATVPPVANLPLPPHSEAEYQPKIAAYTTVLALDPADADAYFQRGLAHAYLRNFPGALADFDASLQVDPSHGSSLEARALLKWITHSASTGDPSGALADYASALALDLPAIEPPLEEPEDFFAARGSQKFKRREFSAAVVDFGKVILLRPDQSYAYQERARARRGARDYTGAMEDFEKALELNPDRHWLLKELGELCLETHDVEQALAYYQRCAAANCTPEDLFRLAELLERFRDYDGATQVYDRILREDSQALHTAEALLHRAAVHQKTGDFQGARADITTALERDTSNTEAYLREGDLLTQMGAFEAAAESFDKAAERSLRIPSVPSYRSILKHRLGDISGALEEMNVALSFAPAQSGLYLQRSEVRLSATDAAGALSDCLKALALNPFDAEAYFHRAKLHLQTGDTGAAVICLSRALEIASRDVSAASYIWALGVLQRDESGAQTALGRILEACKGTSPSSLPENRIALHICGAITREQLWSEIPWSQSIRAGELPCEVLFFTGVKELANGRPEVALPLLRSCVEAGRPHFLSVIVAGLFLKNLGETAK